MADTCAAERPPAPDQAARDRIRNDLGHSLFVEAGAGSGKTSVLVDRVVELVSSGTAQLDEIVAITFTDKAATELRDRLRRTFEALSMKEDEDDAARVALSTRALEQLDGAAIGTLHSFAQRILLAHPIEAGLPTRFAVRDEVSSGLAFERRWIDELDDIHDDPDLERTLLLLAASGAREEALRTLALAFDRDWDLVAERVSPSAPEPPDARAMLTGVLASFDRLAELAGACRESDDRLAARVDELVDFARWLGGIDDEVDLLEALGPASPRPCPSGRVGNLGRSKAWPDVAAVRLAVAQACDQLRELVQAVGEACVVRLASALRARTLAAAEARREAGELEFHDLLVLARALLRDPRHGAPVRAALHRRYRFLLLDEFQDTDPIQIDLAVRIAASDPLHPSTGSAPWSEVPVEPGRLFVVGDPKQSIYRFRRADIETFLRAREGFPSTDRVGLTANFRTGAPIVSWVNDVFERLGGEPPDVDGAQLSRAPFVPLVATRPAPPVGPAVAKVATAALARGTRADEVRAAEAAEVAAAVRTALDEGWSVAERDRWRPCRPGDICILIPARTSLPFLQDALDEVGVAQRAEASSLVYSTRPVRDLLMLARAADDPSDSARVVAALRSPLLGCGDDDLARHRRAGGSWNYLSEPGDGRLDPVSDGLAYLRTLHEDRLWLTPSELLGRIVRDRRALELGFAERRPRDVWRRLRFVVDQARAFSDGGGGTTLRAYLAWVAQQTAEGARVAEAVLPETDDDAVRILTVHAAKGLEFPITIVSGGSTLQRGRPLSAQVAFLPDGRVGYKLGSAVTTEAYAAWAPIDEQMSYEERIRLLYVACTRARDHLVVSVARTDRAGGSAARRTNAEILLAGMGDDSRCESLDPTAGAQPHAVPLGASPAVISHAGSPSPDPDPGWAERLELTLSRASRPVVVAATALTAEGGRDVEPDPGLAKRPRDLDLPPWLKGRYGTAVGRAVHGVLQVVDLATGADVAPAVAAQCEAEGIVERADTVRALVESSLASPSVRRAATRPHWREVYVCAPMPGGRLLEGYLDLLWRDEDGLVVLDHKTAGTTDPAELDRRLEIYRLQGAAYALAVTETTGEPVSRVCFSFLTPGGAVERDLPDVQAAVAEARALIEAGELLVM